MIDLSKLFQDLAPLLTMAVGGLLLMNERRLARLEASMAALLKLFGRGVHGEEG